MYFLLSGEGPTDMGVGIGTADICEGDEFLPGPMAIFVDQIVEEQHQYSPAEAERCGLVSKRSLSREEERLKAMGEFRLPGKKQGREIHYYFNNARVLARIARKSDSHPTKSLRCCSATRRINRASVANARTGMINGKRYWMASPKKVLTKAYP